jgi:RNA-binding protein 39
MPPINTELNGLLPSSQLVFICNILLSLTVPLIKMNNSKERDEGANRNSDLDSSKKITSESGDLVEDLAGKGASNPSQPSDHKHSETSSLLGRGKQSRRERKPMDREARRRGGPSDRNGGRGRQDYDHRPREDRRWERDHDRHDRYHYGGRGPPPRGHYREPEHPRSRSPIGSRRRYSTSPSKEGSVNSRGSLSRSRSRSLGRNDSRNRSPRSNSQNERDSRSGRERGSQGNDGKRSMGQNRRQRGRYKVDDRCSSSSNSDSSTSSSSEDEQADGKREDSTFSKDQRTVFVSQLVMKATEKDIRRYFRRKVGCKVNELILLRDKRTGNHKGSAYIEMGRIEDVNKAVGVTGQPPDFQRFPILVKASEAEKNYVVPASSSVVTASMMGAPSSSVPFLTKDGRGVEAQKVYIGGLDPSVSEEHLFALFSQFGELDNVIMQMDPGTKIRRGFAFLSFKDPKVANLAIQTMSNKALVGRPMKTGWASHPSTISGVDIVTSEEFPEGSDMRCQKAFAVLAQLTGSTSTVSGSSTFESTGGKAVGATLAGDSVMPAAAEKKEVMKDVTSRAAEVDNASKTAGDVAVAEATAAAPSSSESGPKLLRGELTKNILVHNMFDKDSETEEGWAEELREEFTDECGKFGEILAVTVISDQPGGKIYASFGTLESAKKCANNLAGRWFDKRRLRVEYVEESSLPKHKS